MKTQSIKTKIENFKKKQANVINNTKGIKGGATVKDALAIGIVPYGVTLV